jgi:rhodanese-related sulfurtransferase
MSDGLADRYLLSLGDAANFQSITGKAIGVRVSYRTITPAKFDERRKRVGEEMLLIDVREPAEYQLARIEGARLLPLSQFNEWAHSLDPCVETVVMCHHGIRSAQVCAYLAGQGFEKVSNLEGGIDRWSCEVDASVPRY